MTAVPIAGDLDLAAFRTTLKNKAAPRSLAAGNPENGEPIWLVASLHGQPRDALLHRAIVVNVTENKLKCKFDNGNLVMRSASGAPYVNAKGEVVGLHSGSFKDPGNIAGDVLPVESIRTAITDALKK